MTEHTHRRAAAIPFIARLGIACGALLVANGAYLFFSDAPTLFYLLNVGAHLGLGMLLSAILAFRGIRYVGRALERVPAGARGWLRGMAALWAVAAGTGILLSITGSTRPLQPLLTTHIVSCIAALGATGMYLARAAANRERARAEARIWRGSRQLWYVAAMLLLPVVLLALSSSRAPATVANPFTPPDSAAVDPHSYLLDANGEPLRQGAENPFFPSAIEIRGSVIDGEERMPDNFFTDVTSRSCGVSGCHPDIYEQWNSSMHHFSSFNNQWYSKSITYMQEVQIQAARDEGLPEKEAVHKGLQASKWCAGCHDPSVLLTGLWDRAPIAELMKIGTKQEKIQLNAGLGCLMCHSAVKVKDTMGNAGLVLEYPELHKFATSDNAVVKMLTNYFTSLDPGPHRKLFLKSFHTEETAKFCSSCHKVHLYEPVNNYRWFRGFNEYGGWQQSGVSGFGARSFYYPEKSKKCVDCHMPRVPSKDKGNIGGFVHSHRFPAANTAVPYVNRDQKQLDATIKFLTDDLLTIDIFALRRLPPGASPRAEETRRPAKAASGPSQVAANIMEGGGAVSGVALPPATEELTAPLDVAKARVRRGESVSIDVVVRTRKIGHMFPGGTFDAFDVWVEFQAKDERGKIIKLSGFLKEGEEGKKGPVDPAAHFYRARLVDAHGNIIDKRNAWAARAVLYARLIPPGAADTVHYRLEVPPDCGDKIYLTARLRYRKFSHFYNRFAYTGQHDPEDKRVTLDYDDRRLLFDMDPAEAAGKIKEVPDLPIVTLAETKKPVVLQVLPAAAPPPQPRVVIRRDLWERWNDFGIGLLRQGNLRDATAAFRRVVKCRPNYGMGWVNVARPLVQEGNSAEALKALAKARKMRPGRPPGHLGATHYFTGLAYLRSGGRLPEAISSFRAARRLFPRDRVVLTNLGTALRLNEQHEEAIDILKEALTVDAESVPAHYNMMQAANGRASQILRQWERDKAEVTNPQVAARREAKIKKEAERLRRRASQSQKLWARFKADEDAQQRTALVRLHDPDDNNESQPIHEH